MTQRKYRHELLKVSDSGKCPWQPLGQSSGSFPKLLFPKWEIYIGPRIIIGT